MSNQPNPLIARLSALPLWGVFLIVLALFLGGLFTSGVVSFVLLGLVVLLMLVLAKSQWEVLPNQQRAVRAVVIIAVAALAIAKLLRVI